MASIISGPRQITTPVNYGPKLPPSAPINKSQNVSQISKPLSPRASVAVNTESNKRTSRLSQKIISNSSQNLSELEESSVEHPLMGVKEQTGNDQDNEMQQQSELEQKNKAETGPHEVRPNNPHCSEQDSEIKQLTSHTLGSSSPIKEKASSAPNDTLSTEDTFHKAMGKAADSLTTRDLLKMAGQKALKNIDSRISKFGLAVKSLLTDIALTPIRLVNVPVQFICSTILLGQGLYAKMKSLASGCDSSRAGTTHMQRSLAAFNQGIIGLGLTIAPILGSTIGLITAPLNDTEHFTGRFGVMAAKIVSLATSVALNPHKNKYKDIWNTLSQANNPEVLQKMKEERKQIALKNADATNKEIEQKENKIATLNEEITILQEELEGLKNGQKVTHNESSEVHVEWQKRIPELIESKKRDKAAAQTRVTSLKEGQNSAALLKLDGKECTELTFTQKAKLLAMTNDLTHPKMGKKSDIVTKSEELMKTGRFIHYSERFNSLALHSIRFITDAQKAGQSSANLSGDNSYSGTKQRMKKEGLL